MLSFVAIDFENANNSKSSACSLGVTVVENGQIQDTKHWFIKPYPFEMGFYQQRVHKIPLQALVNELTFDLLWNDVRPYLEGRNILAHNASYDLGLLRSLVEHYQLSIENFHYACTVDMAKTTWPQEPKHSLGYLAFNHNFSFNHHRADEDARVCAQLALKMAELHEATTFDELLLRTKVSKRNYNGTVAKLPRRPRARKKPVSAIEPTQRVLSESHPFYGKSVVFTGELTGLSRQDAQHIVWQRGGVPLGRVNSQTHYLVIGKADEFIFGEGSVSSKTRKALDMINQGHPIVILNESEFFELL